MPTCFEHALIRKIASHFKTSTKKVAEDIDPILYDNGYLYFPGMAQSEFQFHDIFRVMSGRFNLGQVLDSNRFAKTGLYQAWQNFSSYPDAKGRILAYALGGGSLLAVQAIDQNPVNVGEGYIIVSFDCLDWPLRIEPMKNFLQSKYPLPLQ